jgi:hypothetical protein
MKKSTNKKKTPKQTKSTRKSLKQDKKLSAKKVGKRVSKSGKIYYEYRQNRTDVKNDSKVKSKTNSKSKVKVKVKTKVKPKITRTVKTFENIGGKIINVKKFSPKKKGYSIIINNSIITFKPNEYSKKAALYGHYKYKVDNNKLIQIDGYDKSERAITKDYNGTTYLKYYIGNKKYNDRIKTKDIFKELKLIMLKGGEIKG